MAGNREKKPLNTGSDQDTLTPEEQALENEMMQDTGTGEATPAPTTKTKVEADVPAEIPEEGAPAEGEPPAGNKQVPLAALQESRATEKELRAALKAAEDRAKVDADRFKLLETRTTTLLEKLTPKPPAPPAEVVPDYQEDPAGWIAHQIKQSGKSLEDVKAELKVLTDEKAQQTESQKQRNAIDEVIGFAATAEREFLKTTPDYDDAGKWLQDARVKELTALELYTPQQINQIIQQEKYTIASGAKAAGKNPAQIVYNLAAARGYVKKDDPAKAAEAAAATAAANKKKLETNKSGREQAGSLSDARGNAPQALTVERLLEMSESEFAKAMLTAEGKALMGA